MQDSHRGRLPLQGTICYLPVFAFTPVPLVNSLAASMIIVFLEPNLSHTEEVLTPGQWMVSEGTDSP